jgi:hypothetical protein
MYNEQGLQMNKKLIVVVGAIAGVIVLASAGIYAYQANLEKTGCATCTS